MTTENNHSFLISASEVPETRIQNELDVLRSKHNEFRLDKMEVRPNSMGFSIVTVQFRN